MRTHRYRITVLGGLTETYREVFGDFRVEPNGVNTTLTGELDQSGLYGALHRIQTLGLELVVQENLQDYDRISSRLEKRRWSRKKPPVPAPATAAGGRGPADNMAATFWLRLPTRFWP